MLDQSYRERLMPAPPAPMSTGPAPMRRPTAPASPQQGMTRAAFEDKLRRDYGVSEIRTGTFEEQLAMRTRPIDMPRGKDIERSQWKPWDPGGASEVYEAILEGFDRLAAEFGGTPPVRQVWFFDVYYEFNSQGDAVASPTVGADFGAGILRVYRGVTRAVTLPIARSTEASAKGRVSQPARPPGELRDPYAGQGSPGLRPASQAESVARSITHELGHGIIEAAMGRVGELDADFIDRYADAVGWKDGKLFDLSDAPVEITEDNWNDKGLVEQPISEYMATAGPAEDFAEAIMAFLTIPEVLRARSPHRYDFIQNTRGVWEQRLLPARSKPGDFPAPTGTSRYA